MRILYIINARIPTEKAHSINVMKTCEALSALGEHVELLVPRRKNPIDEDTFTYYGLKTAFTITKTYSLDLVRFGRFGAWTQMLTFAFSASRYMSKSDANVIYSRDEYALFFARWRGCAKPMYWEMHSANHSLLARFLLPRLTGVVVTTQRLREFCKKHGVAPEDILVAPNGVDLSYFSRALTKSSLRNQLGLPFDAFLAIYTGHLYDWKGAQVFAEAAKQFGEGEYAIFIGGTDRDLAVFEKEYGGIPSIRIFGKLPHTDIPHYLQAADALVLPNVPTNEEATYYTAPIKLFEYMASGAPIVASNIPAIREILNEENAYLVEPKNTKVLYDALQSIKEHPHEAEMRAERAQEEVQEYAWPRRAERIRDFIAV